MAKLDSVCPDCSGGMAPIKYIDATEPGWTEVGARHVELKYAAADAQRSFFMHVIEPMGLVRGSICTQCGRILLRGEPLDA